MPKAVITLWALLNDNADGQSTRFDMLSAEEVTALVETLNTLEALRGL